LLAQQPAHGYELYHRLQADLGQVWHLSLSQTYNILNRLEAKGWIAADIQTQEKLPPKRRFELTQAGRERFDDWLRAPTGSSVRAIRVEFITRLYFAQALDPPRIGPLIDAQLDEVQRSLGRLEQLLAEVPAERPFNRLGVELRTRQLASICDWLAGCRSELASIAGDTSA
jgi:DNA-binding PadR family transcriptional regulator